MDETYVVYRRDGKVAAGTSMGDATNLTVWTPSLTRACPPGLIADHGGFRKNWMFHFVSLVRGRPSYRVYLFKHGREVVAECLVSGGSVRFPFMNRNDLQIGLVHTDVRCRNQGLARRMVATVLAQYRDGASFWWITTDGNKASRRVAEACGFVLAGTARRVSRLGLPQFLLNDPTP